MHLLLVLGVCASLGVAHGAIMAVDLGSEWLKVSVVKPGRSPFSIVVNEMCALYTAHMISPACSLSSRFIPCSGCTGLDYPRTSLCRPHWCYED